MGVQMTHEYHLSALILCYYPPPHVPSLPSKLSYLLFPIHITGFPSLGWLLKVVLPSFTSCLTPRLHIHISLILQDSVQRSISPWSLLCPTARGDCSLFWAPPNICSLPLLCCHCLAYNRMIPPYTCNSIFFNFQKLSYVSVHMIFLTTLWHK